MKSLVQGVRRFRTEVFAQQREYYKKLAAGQHPQALFITCSDSRVVPNIITQTAPGELFVLRNAGNICCGRQEYARPYRSLQDDPH